MLIFFLFLPVAAEESKPKYTCSECGKHYATSSNLSRHRQTHRTLDSGNAKKCQICNKMYVSMPALSMHVLTHNLNHKCDVCGKAFSRPWLLQVPSELVENIFLAIIFNFHRGTCGATQGTSRTVAPTVESPLQTGPTCALTCKPTRLSKTSTASAATSRLP